MKFKIIIYCKNIGNLWILLIICLLLSCHKDKTPTPVVIKAYNDTIQYGTPFTGVPDSRDVSMYEVNMRCFSATHDFSGVIGRLDNIKALGVNLIYLMPVYPVGQLNSINSPYCVQNFREVGNEFGTLTDLRNLVAGAHTRGMAVILDWVANQTSWDNPWITNKSWYVLDANGNITAPTGYTDVAQLNYTNQTMRDSMIADMKYWVYQANIDGFRCDYADNIPVDFWAQAITALRALTPTHQLLMLAEGSRSANYTAGFDYNFGFNFYGDLKTIFNSSDYSSVQELIDADNTNDYIDAFSQNQMVRYLTNHDVNSSDGTPLELFGGITGSMAAFVVVAYMKSVPFIYNGQEVATPIQLTFPYTTTTIDWTINPDVTTQYTQVIGFRNSSAAIRRGTLTSYSSIDVCAFTKILGNDTVAVFSNLRNTIINYNVPASLIKSTWLDAYSGNSVPLSGTISLQPYSFVVLKN